MKQVQNPTTPIVPAGRRRCPRCGTAGSQYNPEGLCGACLLDGGLEAEPELDLLASGPRQFGDYELLEEIARGGMGVVFKARQISLNRVVAVKMILRGEFAGAAELVRFRAEAETVARLQHPNIVAIHEVGENEGQPYFSMGYVEGRNLAQVVGNTPLSAARAATYLKTIAEAVHYAHQQGVLHRDLKPSNVLIDANDQPRVTDFGLAKRLGRDAGLTLTGQVLGSPNFMPPEQASGRNDACGPAADVYSLGALLYHLLTGRPPFMADNIPATLRLVSETEPVAPRLLTPTISRDLQTVCLKCLEKDPARRYSSAEELAEELGRFLRDEPILARPAGRAEKLVRWCRRHPALAGVSTFAILLVIAIVAVSTTAAIRLGTANRAGQEKLREAYLSQAHANRWSGRVGRRFDSLDALQKAAEIRPGLDLRNEAIAAMALLDIRPEKNWPVDLPHTRYQVFDARFERYVRVASDSSVTLHRTSDDHELMRLPGTGYPNYGTIFSPSGRFLVLSTLGAQATTFRVYDLLDQGKIVFQRSEPLARHFRFSADSKKLAVAWKGIPTPSVSVYQTENWREVTSFPAQALPSAVDFSPTGELLAVSCVERSSVKIHNAESGEVVNSLPHSNGVHWVSWDPAGKFIATSCQDRSVYLWDVSLAPPRARQLPMDAIVPYLGFNHRGDLLASGDWHGWAKLWDVGSGKELLRWPLGGGRPEFSADDSRLVCYSALDRVGIFELSSAEECQKLHFNPSAGNGSYSIAYSPDGGCLVSTHKDGLRLWDLRSSRESLFIPHGDTRALCFARDRSGFCTAKANAVHWWPFSTTKEGETNQIIIGLPEELSRQPAGEVEPTNRLVLPAGGKAYVIDALSRRVERRITPPAGAYSAALSPDGHQCATWSLGASVVEVWSADDGSRLASLAAPNSKPFFSRDGRWLVTAAGEEYIFWNRTTWARVHSLSCAMASTCLEGGFWGAYAVQTPGAPTLFITNAAPGFVTIRWAPATPGFILQSTPSFSPKNWTDAPSGAANPVTVGATGGMKFYRLRN